MLISPVRIERPWIRRTIAWCLGYFWTATAALALSHAAGWQYDGDLGWWLVTAYSFPALALGGPLLSLVGNTDDDAIYCLIALVMLTIGSAILLSRPARVPNGS